MRTFRLTSPLMRGQDVRKLQYLLNERFAARGEKRIATDGIYGPATAHAVALAAYQLGLDHYDGVPAVTRVIEHPHLRSPADYNRAAERKHHRENARKHELAAGTHGLASIVAHAERYIGVHENPPESNWGEPYPADWEKEFGFDSGVSWCGCFSGGMVILAGGHVTSRVAYCPSIEADARSKTNGFDLWVPNHNEGVGPGWLVLYNWNGGSEPEHVGVVKEIASDHLVAVEGNTGGRNPSDGGEVAIEQRPYVFTVGYARPRL
jgi:hypothetical protein